MMENNVECPESKKFKTENDSNLEENKENVQKSTFQFSNEPSLESIRRKLQEFCDERNWNQYHSPRNLLLALVGEVGELSEIFQWKGEVNPDDIHTKWSEKEKEHLEQEMSDVFIYLLRLATVCKIDLPKAVESKIKHNEKKYPAEKCFGMNKKYNQLE